MEKTGHIGEASRRLGVTPTHIRTLERQGRVPAPRRDFNGRIYSEIDLRILQALGVGQRPRRLRTLEEIAELR